MKGLGIVEIECGYLELDKEETENIRRRKRIEINTGEDTRTSIFNQLQFLIHHGLHSSLKL